MNTSIDERLIQHLKNRSLAANIALIVSIVFLAAIFAISVMFTDSMHNRIEPLVYEAFDAAQAGEKERVFSLAKEIDAIIEENETRLMLFASHRDIHELKRFSGEMVELGANGDLNEYMQALSGILAYIELFAEYNRLSIGNIL